MALFGVPQEKAQQIARDAAREAVDAAVGALKREYDSRMAVAEGEVGSLRGKLDDATGTLSRLETTVADQAKRLEGSSAKIADLNTRLANYEASQHRSGIVATIASPPSDMTFESVLETARHIADEAYKRVRDYFLVQMAKKGYEREMPDFEIRDKDSNLCLSFYQSDHDTNRLNTQLSIRTSVWIINFPADFNFTSHTPKRLHGYDPSRTHRDFTLCVDETGQWADQLRDDLPDMLKAYMFGHALAQLNTNDHRTAVDLMRKYRLEQQTPLLQRMSELMQQDARLAEALRNAYSAETR